MSSALFDIDLGRNPANFQPLTPLFPGARGRGVSRSSRHHPWRSDFTYAEFYARAAGWLRRWRREASARATRWR